jgi:hypothetical protein
MEQIKLWLIAGSTLGVIIAIFAFALVVIFFTFKLVWKYYEFFFRIPIEDLYQTSFKYNFKKFTSCLLLAIVIPICVVGLIGQGLEMLK